MGVKFRIACHQCHEFLELAKWFPDVDMTFTLSNYIGASNYRGVQTDEMKIRKAIKEYQEGLLKERPGHWISEYIPYLESFVEDHHTHELAIYNDTGDSPWYSYEPDWHRWKEIQGPGTSWSSDFSDVELPRNLIDDVGIDNWQDALKHYVDHFPCMIGPGIPDEMETIFNGFLYQAKSL